MSVDHAAGCSPGLLSVQSVWSPAWASFPCPLQFGDREQALRRLEGSDGMALEPPAGVFSLASLLGSWGTVGKLWGLIHPFKR